MTEQLPTDDFDIPGEDTPFEDLWKYSADQLATILATKYDPTIQAMLNALTSVTSFSQEDWMTVLAQAKALSEEVMGLPDNPTLGNMRRHQQAADLIVLGMLAQAWAERSDEVERNSK
jgi:hypothetical protein